MSFFGSREQDLHKHKAALVERPDLVLCNTLLENCQRSLRWQQALTVLQAPRAVENSERHHERFPVHDVLVRLVRLEGRGCQLFLVVCVVWGVFSIVRFERKEINSDSYRSKPDILLGFSRKYVGVAQKALKDHMFWTDFSELANLGML